MPAARDLSICESYRDFKSMRQAPKSATPRSGRLRRACDALLGRNPGATDTQATVGFAQDQLLSLAWRGLVPVPALRGSGTQAPGRPPLACHAADAAELPLRRQRQFETPPASSGSPNQNPGGPRRRPVPQARRWSLRPLLARRPLARLRRLDEPFFGRALHSKPRASTP